MTPEDHGFLDILAAVADHEKPLALKSPDPENPMEESSKPAADAAASVEAQPTISQASSQLQLEDDDEMALFSAQPPMLHGFDTPPNDDELAALFADLPELPDPMSLLDDQESLLAGLEPIGTLPHSESSGSLFPIGNVSMLESQLSQPLMTAPIIPRAQQPSPSPAMQQPQQNHRPQSMVSTPQTLAPASSGPSPLAQAPLPTPTRTQVSQPAPHRPSPSIQTPPQRIPPTTYSPQVTSQTDTGSPQFRASPAASPAVVIQGLLKQVPKAQHQEFLSIYTQLQNKQITADEFTARAKDMLSLPPPSAMSRASPVARPSPLTPSASGGSSTVGAALDQMRLKQTQGQQYAQNYGRTPAPGRVSQLLTRPLQQTMQPGVQFRPLPDNIPRAGQLPIPARAGPEVDASKLDVTDMMDVTSYTGLNMREEEDNMANSILTAPGSQYQIPGVSRIKDQSFLNLPALRKKVEAVAQGADVSEVDKDLLPYLALAAQERLRDLLQCMIQAAKHRTGALHERFLQNERELIAKGEDALDLQVITRQDPRKVLSALEKKERAQEAKLRAAKTAATQGQGEGADSMDVPGGAGGGDKEEGAKKKRKAIRDKDLPEHIRLERANAALATAIGGAPMKSWMLAGGSASAGGSTSGPLKVVPSRKRKADGELGTPMSGTKGPPGTAVHNSIRLPGGGLGRKKGGEPVARKVTLKDALFCLEGEHAMTKSLLVYKWWANVT